MKDPKAHKDILSTKAVAVKQTGDAAPPRIAAKGRGYNAERILDIAFAEGVKVRQDSELTDILEALDVDSPIPLEALHTVSLILEKVYEYELAAKASSEGESAPVADITHEASS